MDCIKAGYTILFTGGLGGLIAITILAKATAEIIAAAAYLDAAARVIE